MRRGAVVTASAMLGFASIVAVGATAGASAQAPQVVSNSTFTLNLLGAPLIIDVTTDPGGNLVDVALNPPTPPADVTATVKPNKVVFVNTDGTMKIKVSAKHGGQSVTARAATLLDVSGAGSWGGDVFGTGEATMVNYTVGALTDGSPDVTIDSVTSPLANVIGATVYHPADGDGHGAKASASVEFASLGQSRSFKVEVSMHDDDDGATTAELRVSLSRVRGAQTASGEAVGPHTWTGTLCDSTTATFDYSVAADGSVIVGTLPAGAISTTDEHGTSVRFATGERVQIKVKNDNGTITVGAKVSVHCKASAPTVNTPVVTTVPEFSNGTHPHSPKNSNDSNDGSDPHPSNGSHHSGDQRDDG